MDFNPIKLDLASLPPTKGSAKYHSFRVYHQVQEWLGNQLPPEMWGWKRGFDGNLDITTLDPPAPDTVLFFAAARVTVLGNVAAEKLKFTAAFFVIAA